MLEVACQCGKSYKLRDEMAGRNVRCKQCGEVIQIPELDAATPPPPGPTDYDEDRYDDGRDGPPWERRDELGVFGAFYETVKQSLLQPTELFRRMRISGGIGEPLVFNLIAQTVSVVGLYLWIALIFVVLTAVGFTFAPPSGPNQPSTGAIIAFGAIGFIMYLVFLVVMSAIGSVVNSFIRGGILHLCLMILKADRNGFEATYRATCYAYAPMLLMVIPLFGITQLIAVVMVVVDTIIGLREAHGISTGQAALAFFLPTLFFFVCCVIPFILLQFIGIAAQTAG